MSSFYRRFLRIIILEAYRTSKEGNHRKGTPRTVLNRNLIMTIHRKNITQYKLLINLFCIIKSKCTSSLYKILTENIFFFNYTLFKIYYYNNFLWSLSVEFHKIQAMPRPANSLKNIIMVYNFLI